MVKVARVWPSPGRVTGSVGPACQEYAPEPVTTWRLVITSSDVGSLTSLKTSKVRSAHSPVSVQVPKSRLVGVTTMIGVSAGRTGRFGDWGVGWSPPPGNAT